MTGSVYLLYFVAAISAQVLISRKLTVSGTAINLSADALYIALTLLLYRIFEPVSRTISLIAALFSLVGCAVMIAAQWRLIGSQVNPLMFFGPFCILLGYLILRSTFVPRLLVMAGVGWLIYLVPGLPTLRDSNSGARDIGRGSIYALAHCERHPAGALVGATGIATEPTTAAVQRRSAAYFRGWLLVRLHRHEAPAASVEYKLMSLEQPQSNALRAIGWSGLIAGALDISDALVFYGVRGVSPRRVLQGIAGGLLGARAMQGGWPCAILNLALHFLIAFTAAAVYYVASRHLRILRKRPVVSGVLFGIAVFLFMNMVVVPLSAIHRSPLAMLTFNVVSLNAVLALLLFIGLPIALVVNRLTNKNEHYLAASGMKPVNR
jgi:hypothetical protein